MKFVTPYNYEFTENCCEKKNVKPSMTCLDMSYTVRELLAKFTSGSVPQVQHDGLYDDDPSFSDLVQPVDYDLSDITEMELEVNNLKSRLSDAKKAIEDKKEEAAKLKAAKSEASEA